MNVFLNLNKFKLLSSIEEGETFEISVELTAYK